MKNKAFLFVIVAMLVAAGCSGQATATPAAMMNEATPTGEAMLMQSSPTPEAMMMETSPTAPEAMMAAATPSADAMLMESDTATPQAMMTEAMAPTEGSMMSEGTPSGTMAANAWLGVSLTDASTGKSFTLGDFAGKTVLVELITTQCPACLEQQQSIQAYLAGGASGVVVVSLDIAANATTSDLLDHIGMTHFTWSFAVAPGDLVAQIGDQYGSQYLDAANAPLLVIDAMGDVHPLPLHLTGQSDIQSALESYSPKM